MAKIDAGINIDVAYDTTPERALYSQIMKNPELSLEGAEYIGEKPGFMRVKANEWDLHDWDQYDRADEAERGRPKDGGPTIRDRIQADLGADPRRELVIENVWTVLKLQNPPDSASEGRAYVNFSFMLQFRESEADGENTADISLGDHIWKCKRVDTELLEE